MRCTSHRYATGRCVDLSRSERADAGFVPSCPTENASGISVPKVHVREISPELVNEDLFRHE